MPISLGSTLGRLEISLVRLLFSLSPSAQIRLSGAPQIVVDGHPLHHEMQFLLAARRRLGGGNLRSRDPVTARRKMRAEALRYAGPLVPVREVRNLFVDGGAGRIRARHYAPNEAGPCPLLVFFHGGGFVSGDLDTHDTACRKFCQLAGLHVLAIDYRLAPEFAFPAAVEDAVAAFRWARAHAAELGADPSRVLVGGDSAGGNLAAVVCHVARDAGEQPPVLQLLIYPAMDNVTPRPSWTLFREGFFLEKADMDWYTLQYAGETMEVRKHPRVSPLFSADFSRLPPALVVTAGFDPLRDEGEVYASRLEEGGTPVTLMRMNGFIHGFINMTAVSPAAERAFHEVAERLRVQSRTVPATPRPT